MVSIKLNLPESALDFLTKHTKNKNKFIREAINEKIKHLLEKELIEGYSQETEEDLKDWDVTAGDGIE